MLCIGLKALTIDLLNGAGLRAHVLAPCGSRTNGWENFVGCINHREHPVTMNRLHKVLGNHLVQGCDDRVEVAIDIDDDNGVAMQAELLPREALEQFLHRTYSTRERDHGIDHSDDG